MEIGISEFKKVEMRVGRVLRAERAEGTERLLRLEVDFGSFTRQAVTGLGHLYGPEHFAGRSFVFVLNLTPKRIRGLLSNCMILAAVAGEDRIVPIIPESEIEPGAEVT